MAVVGQGAVPEGITPRVLHVGECQTPTARKRAYDVDFAIGDVATTPKAKASSEAKRLVKIFSNEGVADMYRANGLGEAEAKRATSAVTLETSRASPPPRPGSYPQLTPPTAPYGSTAEGAGSANEDTKMRKGARERTRRRVQR